MKKVKNKPRTRTFGSVRGKKVIVAMSGGVDSSVAAALLKRAGPAPEPRTRTSSVRGKQARYGVNFDVTGIYMKLCDGKKDSEKRARMVARKLGIPFYIFNFEKEFKKKVVDYFLKEYKAGRTPNPCVVCNKEIKFGLLLEKALKLGADFVATGHYARKRVSNTKHLTPTTHLLKGKDKNKDQSYFLWQLNQKQLKHILFPVGNYTKEEVRKLAKKNKLPTAETPESQEICFVLSGINDFLAKFIKPRPGPVVEQVHYGVKKIIGKHKGLCFYTIGQRKGIGLSGGPFYVLDKDFKKNTLIITRNEKDLYKKELIMKNVNWISGEPPKFPLKVSAKIRYKHTPAFAILTRHLKFNTYHLIFDRPQRAITPGQSAVFYIGKELLGGGVII